MTEKHLEAITTNVRAYCDTHLKFEFDPLNPRVRLHEPSFGADEINAMIAQSLTTMVTMGSQVRGFEEQCAAHFGSKYCVMNNSGSSANLLAVAALANPAWKNPLKAGDEVIVPALSWSTTVWPLIQHQLVPVLADCDLETYNFDMSALEAAITPKTRAIMLVHVYGNPCGMDAIMALAKKHKLYVIEDCCEAMGAKFNGRPVGSFGDAGTMSLYYSHHITTFEGGLCFTDSFEMAELLRILRAHGWSREADEKDKYVALHPDIDPRFIFVNIGYNLRPTEVQAAMGVQQLAKLDGFVEARRKAHQAYCAGLSKYSEFLRFQQEQEKGHASWFGFGMMLASHAPFTLKDITGFLHEKNIETRPIIAGNIARHPALKMFPHRVAGSLSNCDTIMARGFAIGCHHVVSMHSCEYVVACMDEFMKAQGIRVAA
jgi:CDP-6-deoxy-D-xylo-4-hexulose-3-dehydrase